MNPPDLSTAPNDARGRRGRPLALGFLGVGWIGLHRLQAIQATGLAQDIIVVDPSDAQRAKAAALIPSSRSAPDLAALLACDLDGVVIATPSALHAPQCVAALSKGLAVFCQKPLGRSADEVAGVVDAARRANRLLAVDLSYRRTEGMQRLCDIVKAGGLGRVYAIDLVFHNAYGPDKDWFFDASRSGGGCVMDLGVHLIDLALNLLDYPKVESVSSSLWCGGEPLDRVRARRAEAVEDYAVATLILEGDVVVRLACSWTLHAGRPAEIAVAVYGVLAGARFCNLDGSFYDFTLELNRGAEREVLTAPPEDWGGRAAAEWARRLAFGEGFDAATETLTDVARVIDRIYQP
jgi:predicted dehydrogenase